MINIGWNRNVLSDFVYKTHKLQKSANRYCNFFSFFYMTRTEYLPYIVSEVSIEKLSAVAAYEDLLLSPFCEVA